MTSITYRRMTAGDLDAAHALSQAVRWAHRREDWEFMLDAGTGFVAEDDGVVTATGLCWKYGSADAALGMIIVAPERQGRGIGRGVMELIFAELGECGIQLTATHAGQPLYEKLGFTPDGGVVQHQGTLGVLPGVELALGERLRAVTAADLPALSALSQRALGMPRHDVLARLLHVADGVLLENAGEPVGFSLIRRFGKGHMIGPVIAPDAKRAQALIGYWASEYAGGFVRVDVSGDSGLSPWVESLGLSESWPSVRMARGRLPESDGTLRQFAILNQAMG